MFFEDDKPFEEEGEKPSAFRRYGLAAFGSIICISVGAGAYVLLKGNSGPAPRPHMEEHITQVQLPPPPPPPPPPKIPPPDKKPEETPKQSIPTPAKAVVKPAPKAPSPPAAVTTSIQGNGPGSLAAGNGGGGDCIGAGCGSGDGSGGDNDAYYSGLVKTQIEEALRHDERLKYAKYRAVISFSLDGTGHVAHAVINSFSGDDDARSEVQRVVSSISTGDTPPASMVTKEFSVRITERARG
jgi:hypothetical protein